MGSALCGDRAFTQLFSFVSQNECPIVTMIPKKFASFIGWIICCAVGEVPISAAVLHVWIQSPTPAPPYVSWATAAHNLQDAVDAANPGDTVLVTDGVYAAGGRALSDSILNRVVVDKAITMQSVNGPRVTVIDGASTGRCAYISDGAVLAGFTLTNGAAETDPAQGEGGGVWCESAGVVTNCLIVGNSADFGGGASGGTLYNCTLIDNLAFQSGGGAISSILFSSMLSNNAASGGGGGAASAVLFGCSLKANVARSGGGASASIVSNCVLAANFASRTGGGAAGGTLYNCTLSANVASDVAGGGAFVSTLYNCLLTGNSSEDGGGASGGLLYHCALTANRCGRNGGGADFATLNNCSVVGNFAGSPGGGVFGCVLYNCILAQNSTGGSGGGAADSSLYNCTVTGNSADFFAGGVFASVLSNSIVFYNVAFQNPNCDDFSSLSYSCTTPLPLSGVGNIAQEPGLANLAAGDYHLLFGSPCINAAINQNWMLGATDLDGNARISGGVVDMGAYELPLSATGLVTGGGWVNSPSGALSPNFAKWAGVAVKGAFNFSAKSAGYGTIGSSEFQVGKVVFESTGLDRLILAGPKTQLRGRGTINGQGNFLLTLWATDGQLSGGGGLDRFRIKIWDQSTGIVVYDNQRGSPDTAELSNTTVIQGGSIAVHKSTAQ